MSDYNNHDVPSRNEVGGADNSQELNPLDPQIISPDTASSVNSEVGDSNPLFASNASGNESNFTPLASGQITSSCNPNSSSELQTPARIPSDPIRTSRKQDDQQNYVDPSDSVYSSEQKVNPQVFIFDDDPTELDTFNNQSFELFDIVFVIYIDNIMEPVAEIIMEWRKLSDLLVKVPEAEKETCSICQDDESMESLWLLPCCHKHHRKCIMRWFLYQSTCPQRCYRYVRI